MNKTDHSHPLEQIGFKEEFSAYVVEASAGTGKTWTIERLYIKALLEGTSALDKNIAIGIENILVVTFTEDATNELKERLHLQIEKTINWIIYFKNNPDFETSDIFIKYLINRQKLYDYKKDIILLTRALQNFDMASIFTIHGFCNKILHDYPFECRTNTKFELVKDKSFILHEITLNFLRCEIYTNPKFQESLSTVIANLSHLFNVGIGSMILDEVVAKLPRDLFKIVHNKYEIKYKVKSPNNINFLMNDELEDLQTAKADFIAYLINYIDNYYPGINKNSVNLSYDELIQIAADCIAISDGLATKVFNKFPIAFIDEFQDTDNLQWQIFSTIYHLSNKIRRGHLVVVGDPKQAIYKFRGADIDTYLEARKEISHNLHLMKNYRSHPHIMNFINQLFSLTNQSTSLDSSYLGSGIDYHEIKASKDYSQNILPAKHDIDKGLSSKNVAQTVYDEQVQLVVIKGNTKPLRNQKLHQAIAFEILSLLNANPSLKGKIAILVTKNTEATYLVNYLAKFGVRATELKLGSIFSTTTAIELYNILIALSDLANLSNLIKAAATKLVNTSLVKLTNVEDNKCINELRQRFFKYKQIWESLGIFSVIYSLLEDICIEQNGLNNRELANLWQLAELLNKQSKKLNNYTELLFWFKERINSTQNNSMGNLEVDNEEIIRLDNDDEQIIITTQHRAKGLEYEILFCPYFKSNIVLDGLYDFNYRRPFFSNYRKDSEFYSSLVLDTDLGSYVVNKDNKEIHRLNYVALTRAKSRIYIYLKQNTITKATGKYNSKERPDKLVELFGYVKSNPNDLSHTLFNYPDFFGTNPMLALKNPGLFPGVVAYNRDDLTESDLENLRINFDIDVDEEKVPLNKIRHDFKADIAYVKQSYSGLTRVDGFEKDFHYYEKHTAMTLDEVVKYRYSILNDKNLGGAVFGTLFHELCEIYPFSDSQLEAKLYKYNIDSSVYISELKLMLDEAFRYPLLDKAALQDFSAIINELEFNLNIETTVQISQVISEYFGIDHPFSNASINLENIQSGFLVGFIDVCFEYEGKYWVLDYKTNNLTDYSGANKDDIDNHIIKSMSEHHYYLQYLLYLVALKRYLESRLNIRNAADLIGGAVYYYVRGIYTENSKPGDGLFIDDKCQLLVSRIDQLLRRGGIN